jgi:hypothetical protein
MRNYHSNELSEARGRAGPVLGFVAVLTQRVTMTDGENFRLLGHLLFAQSGQLLFLASMSWSSPRTLTRIRASSSRWSPPCRNTSASRRRSSGAARICAPAASVRHWTRRSSQRSLICTRRSTCSYCAWIETETKHAEKSSTTWSDTSAT